MKKLLTIAAALLVAAVTQAATTSWDYSIYMNDADGNDLTGTLVLSQGGTVLDTASLVDGSAEGSIAEVTYGAGETVDVTLTTTLTSGETISKTISLAFDLPKPGYPDIASSLGSYGDDIAMGFCGSALDELDLNMSAADAAAAGWTVVPEPCSVALLAIGLAAFGLKRKIA